MFSRSFVAALAFEVGLRMKDSKDDRSSQLRQSDIDDDHKRHQ